MIEKGFKESFEGLRSSRRALAWLAGTLLLLLVAFWLTPRYQSQLVTADGAQRWDPSESPPSREIVWQDAVPITGGRPAPTAVDARPPVSDGEQLRYSTVQSPHRGLEIHRSHRLEDGWSISQAVAALNSEADDAGPFLSADGQTLYLYSNRDGGMGGMDLYRSSRSGDGWSEPVNLGRDVNSSADDVDPSLSPDGAFLVFASDRPIEQAQKANFDLYRMRLPPFESSPENLGPGINTAADEFEPRLTAAGFQLSFSRSAGDDVSQVALYQSTAKEVFRQRHWDASSWHALGGNLSRAAPYLWLLLVVFCSLALLVWAVRFFQKHHVAISSFLIGALLLHILMVTGSFFVYFQQHISDKLKSIFEEEPVVASQIFVESASSQTSEQPAFDRVADLALPDSPASLEVSKQTFDEQTQLQPIESARPVQIAHRPAPAAESTMNAAGEPIVAGYAPPQSTPDVPEPLRRAAMSPEQPSEQIAMTPTTAVDTPEVKALRPQPSEVARRDPATPLPTPVELIPTESPVQPNPSSESEPIEASPTPVAATQATVPLALERAAVDAMTEPNAFDATIAEQPVASTSAQPLPTLVAPELNIERTMEAGVPAMAQAEPSELAPELTADVAPLNAEPLVPRPASQSVVRSTTDPLPSELSRSRLETETDAEAASLASMVPLAQAQAEPEPVPLQRDSALELDRQAALPSSMDVATLEVDAAGASDINSVQPSAEVEPMALLASGRTMVPAEDALANSPLSRRSARPSRTYADAQIGLQSLLLRRNLDEATKTEVVKQFGGSDQTLAAIQGGLSWLEQHQAADGHWGLHNFAEQCKEHDRCGGHGGTQSDTAGTGLALLPFLGDGHTHQKGARQETVARGISWLIQHQKPDGNLFSGGEGNALMYSHGIAAIALCECYGMSGDASLRKPAQQAIDFIIAAQDPSSGGWRYQPRQGADTSVVGWQVMALKSAQMANLNVPEKSLKEARRWLESVSGKNQQLGQFAYQGGRFNPAMTAEALLCLEYMNEPQDSDLMNHGATFLMSHLPQQGQENSYYWYYATQAAFHLQGEPWRRWNEKLHPLLINTQKLEGPMKGTWDPGDQWEHRGGRVYATSLRLLMLEVYYRHLPIYQALDLE